MEVATLEQVKDCINDAMAYCHSSHIGVRCEVNMLTFASLELEAEIKFPVLAGFLTINGIRVFESKRPSAPACRVTVYPFNPNLKGGVE